MFTQCSRHSSRRAILALIPLLILCSSPSAYAQVADGFDYPVGLADGSGWLQNFNGLQWLDSYDYGGNCGIAYHPGTDFNKDNTTGNQDLGEPVRAVANGVVVASDYDGTSTWGNAILIEHTLPDGTKVRSQYGHLKDRLVSQGSVVSRGQVIGHVGTGSAAYPVSAHLHFEIRTQPLGVSLGLFAFPCGQTTAYVSARYTNPKAFINSHRVLGAGDKTLVKSPAAPTVYWLQNGRLYGVISESVMNAMSNAGMAGWGFALVTTVPADVLTRYTLGPDFVGTDSGSNGLLIRQVGTTTVFLVENGRRRSFTSEEALSWNDVNWFGDVIDVPSTVLNTFVPVLGQNVNGIGEGEADIASKQPFKDAYARLMGSCGATSTWRGWPGSFATCLEFPQSTVLTALSSGVSGISGKYQNYGNDTTRFGGINSTSLGTFGVWGAIYTAWQGANYSGGSCGFPTSDEFAWGSNRRSNFEGGYIYWVPTTGSTFVVCGTPPTACTSFSIDPNSASPTSAGGSALVTITGAPSGCTGGSWAASGNGSWLTVAPASGSGSGSATVFWTHNTSTSSRSGSATIAGKSFAVTQGAAPDSGGTQADFDGDGHSDLTVYNISSGVWSVLTSSTSYNAALNIGWGGTGYTPVPGDYDGDGKADLGVYHQSSGNWYVLLSGNGFTTTRSRNVGGPGWAAVPGDYDGDSQTDFVVYNVTTGQWYGLLSSTGYSTTINKNWGGSGYTPVPGDYDGDGKADLAVYHQATGNWYVLLSGNGFSTARSRNVGGTGWTAVPGDYDGDGQTDFVVYNVTTGQWYGLKSGAGYTTTVNTGWGGTGYVPVKGDFDGDGSADLAVYHPATGNWYVLLSGAHYTASLSKNWGGVIYMPVPSFF